MRPFSPAAEGNIDDLIAHDERLGRGEAIRNLIAALKAVSERIETSGGAGLLATTPAGVFYHTADIPNRLPM